MIKEVNAKRFAWKSIMTQFGVPRALVSDNDTQFDGSMFQSFCTKLEIRNYYSTLTYPQCNGQAKIFNKTMLNGIKKRLEELRANG